MNSQLYRVGHKYRDLTKRVPADEFINWLDTMGHTIGTTGGIRPKKFLDDAVSRHFAGLPSSLILVTTKVAQQYHNPWEDVVDYSTGQILYWGDAKYDDKRREKRHTDFNGNRILERIHDEVLKRDLATIPPILHFTKSSKGWIQFSGLCVLDSLETTWYEDKGRPIKNFRCHLSILDEEVVPLEWIHRRASTTAVKQLNRDCPEIWRDYITGSTRRLLLWRKSVRSAPEQLPPPDTDDARVLDEVVKLTPEQFERFCTRLLEELAIRSGTQHIVRGTRLVRDGGFDFFGTFTLPVPLHYEINFKGEAKRYRRSNGVGPEAVSRLVARLQRGEYGIFITTSYYTKAAQEEVFEDGYPVRLFSGSDIVTFLHLIGLVREKSTINPDWLARVTGPQRAVDHPSQTTYPT
jgi:hypothetical protein